MELGDIFTSSRVVTFLFNVILCSWFLPNVDDTGIFNPFPTAWTTVNVCMYVCIEDGTDKITLGIIIDLIYCYLLIFLPARDFYSQTQKILNCKMALPWT